MTITIAIITVLHLIVAVALVFLILLHSGKGGLGDLFGGGMQAGGMGGATLAERNLNRLTVVAAVLFAATTVTLTVLLGS